MSAVFNLKNVPFSSHLKNLSKENYLFPEAAEEWKHHHVSLLVSNVIFLLLLFLNKERFSKQRISEAEEKELPLVSLWLWSTVREKFCEFAIFKEVERLFC